MDPLLPAVFIALTPEPEFPLLCERMPPILIATWLTKHITSKRIDKREVYCGSICDKLNTSQCVINGHGLIRAKVYPSFKISPFPHVYTKLKQVYD